MLKDIIATNTKLLHFVSLCDLKFCCLDTTQWEIWFSKLRLLLLSVLEAINVEKYMKKEIYFETKYHLRAKQK